MAEQPKIYVIFIIIAYVIIIILSIISFDTIKYDYIYLSKICISYLVLQISQDMAFTIVYLTSIFSEHHFKTFKIILITYTILILPFLAGLEFSIYYFMPDNNSFLDISIFCWVVKDLLTFFLPFISFILV